MESLCPNETECVVILSRRQRWACEIEIQVGSLLVDSDRALEVLGEGTYGSKQFRPSVDRVSRSRSAYRVMGKETRRAHKPLANILAISLQQTLFLKLLLEASKGHAVSLEMFEDIGVEEASGQRLQCRRKAS